MSLPASGEAKYRGEWFFMTDAKQNRKVEGYAQGNGHTRDFSSAVRYGNTGATNPEYKADFSVDFA